MDNIHLKYLTSAWNPNSKSSQVIENFFEIGEECRVINAAKYQLKTDVRYGDSPRQRFDIYGTRDMPKDAPLFIFIHGGFWQKCSTLDSTFCVEQMVKAGHRVIMLEYDLCPTGTLRTIHSQIKAGLSKIMKMAAEEYQCSRVVISGHSVGAWLSIFMLTKEMWQELPHKELIKRVILFGGFYDLTEAQHADNVNKNNILGLENGDVEEFSPLLQDYSHLSSASGCEVNVLMLTGEWDAPGLIEQGHALFAKLKKEGVNVEHFDIKSMDHFDLVIAMRSAESPVTKLVLKE